MKENVVHRLVGYDPVTDRLAYQHDIPRPMLDAAKIVAHVGPSDPDAIGSYPLEMAEAQEIAGLLQIKLPSRELVFFLEPFALPTITRSVDCVTV